MKINFFLWLVLLLILGVMVGCSGGGSGGDDDSGDDEAATDDDSSANDDSAADDDAADDDDTPGGPHAPVISDILLFVASTDPDFEVWGEKNPPVVVGVNEAALAAPIYSDPECDLEGGAMFYALDGGQATKYKNIPPNVSCQYSEGANIIGYELIDIPGAMDESPKGHSLEIWWTDNEDHESIHQLFDYSVEDSPFAHGGTAEDFTLTDKDGNQVSLSDYNGKIVVIEGYTGWDTYSAQEADELAALQAEWNTNHDPVQVLGLMAKDAMDSANIQQTDLQIFSAAHGWDGLIPALDDGGAVVQDDYWLSDGYPFNMILDADHVVLMKWHGYGVNMVEYYIDCLLTGW